MPEYIECTLEECTHARLPNGEVVACFGKCATEPYLSDKRILIDKPECNSLIFWNAWPDLGITPVKAKPKPEPVVLEAVVERPGNAFYMINFYRNVLAQVNLESGDRVRVTIEKVKEGE